MSNSNDSDNKNEVDLDDIDDDDIDDDDIDDDLESSEEDFSGDDLESSDNDYSDGVSDEYTPNKSLDTSNKSFDLSKLNSNLNSPLILPISILLYSAFQQNTSGIPYMIFLIIFVILRSNLFSFEKVPEKCIYKLPLFGKTLNINVFISIFSLSYIILPMIILQKYNIASILIVTVYTLTNIGLSLYNGCYEIKSILIGDIFFSLVCGVLSILIIIAVNSSLNSKNNNFLFINNENSSGEICSMPSKQNFVCNVYQNGQLISKLPNVPN